MQSVYSTVPIDCARKFKFPKLLEFSGLMSPVPHVYLCLFLFCVYLSVCLSLSLDLSVFILRSFLSNSSSLLWLTLLVYIYRDKHFLLADFRPPIDWQIVRLQETLTGVMIEWKLFKVATPCLSDHLHLYSGWIRSSRTKYILPYTHWTYPRKYVPAVIWTSTYIHIHIHIPMVNSQLYTYVYTHKHTCTHTYSYGQSFTYTYS